MLTTDKNLFTQFDDSIISSLTKIVGKENIITDSEGVYAYSFDCAHIPFDKKYPRVIVLP